MKPKLLTLGGATFDTIIAYDDAETLNLQSARGTLSYLLLEEGKKIEVTAHHTSSGGGATNSAVAFKRLGFEVSCLCKIGQDSFAAKVLADLESEGINTDLIMQTEKVDTASSYIVPSLKGDRTVFAYRGANATWQQDCLPWQAMAEHEACYITSLSGASAECLLAIGEFAQQKKMSVALNPGISQLRRGGNFIAKALKDVNCLLLNAEEAKQLMVSLLRFSSSHRRPPVDNDLIGPASAGLLADAIYHEDVRFSLLEFFQRVMAIGPETVVVTNGDEGVYVAHEKTVYFHACPSAKVVNTIGAGDAFSASFVAARHAGHSIDEAIRWGIVNSASVISYHDAKQGLLSLTDLEQATSHLAKDLLSHYVLKSS